MPAPPEGADWGPEIKVIDRLIYRFNGQGYLPRGRTHLFVLPAEGGTPHQVTDGDVDDRGSLAWSPDGEALVFSANRHADAPYRPLDTEVYEVPAAGGEVRALTDRNGPDGDVAVSPDGRWIAYTGFDDRHLGYQVAGLYLMHRDGSGLPALDGRPRPRRREPEVGRRRHRASSSSTTTRAPPGSVTSTSAAGSGSWRATSVASTSAGPTREASTRWRPWRPDPAGSPSPRPLPTIPPTSPWGASMAASPAG